jgi:hypothetical protein
VPEPDVSPSRLKIVRIASGFVSLTASVFRRAAFELRNSERTLSTIKPLPSPREEPVRNKAALEIVSGSLDIEQKSPTKPATRLQMVLALWPWALLALTGVITAAWAIALCWAAFALVRWLID